MNTTSKFDERFTREEAELKLGRRVRNPREFSGVPQWTLGTVVRADEAHDGYNVVIQWHLPERQYGTHHRPLQDWFTKYEYENFLVEEAEIAQNGQNEQ